MPKASASRGSPPARAARGAVAAAQAGGAWAGLRRARGLGCGAGRACAEQRAEDREAGLAREVLRAQHHRGVHLRKRRASRPAPRPDCRAGDDDRRPRGVHRPSQPCDARRGCRAVPPDAHGCIDQRRAEHPLQSAIVAAGSLSERQRVIRVCQPVVAVPLGECLRSWVSDRVADSHRLATQPGTLFQLPRVLRLCHLERGWCFRRRRAVRTRQKQCAPRRGTRAHAPEQQHMCGSVREQEHVHGRSVPWVFASGGFLQRKRAPF